MPPESAAKQLILLFGLLLVLLLGAPASGAASSLRGLQADLAHQLALAGPQDGAYVYDVTAKQTLFSERAEVPRPPASVEKLYTATAALATMGPGARLSTDVYGVGRLLPGGVWEGSIYLRGGGDPTFGSGAVIAQLYGGLGTSVGSLVQQLVKVAGIHQITGSILGDESFLDSRRGEPASGYSPDPELEGLLSGLAFNRGAALGNGAHAPAAYAARALWGALKAKGVSIRGSSRAGATPPGAALLAHAQSPTIGQLLGLTLPPSDNYFAEMILKDLGALYGGSGSTPAGAALVKRTIAKAFGIHPRLVDGSGLSRSDRTSPYEVVHMLAGITSLPFFGVLKGDLAVAGHSGTLESRMRGTAAAGRCHAKTGTLTGASNLAGYCDTAGGHLLAFAIFNDGISTEAAHTVQDHMAATIASY
ncbi:MAG: D-alanyl-D-alanine carboxypeptidase/D-alanyl-D-alanine endopeptidase [Solirubrobacteraceae bacterium]